MATDSLLLQQAYVDAFNANRVFVKNNFPLIDNLTELIGRGIIKDKYKHKITSSLDVRHELTASLLQENDIKAFDKFIELCDEKNIRVNCKKFADYLRQEINKQKQKVGLPLPGNLFQVMQLYRYQIYFFTL